MSLSLFTMDSDFALVAETSSAFYKICLSQQEETDYELALKCQEDFDKEFDYELSLKCQENFDKEFKYTTERLGKNLFINYLQTEIQALIIPYLSILDIKNLVITYPILEFSTMWEGLLHKLIKEEDYLDMSLIDNVVLRSIDRTELSFYQLYLHELICRKHITQNIQDRTNRFLLLGY